VTSGPSPQPSLQL